MSTEPTVNSDALLRSVFERLAPERVADAAHLMFPGTLEILTEEDSLDNLGMLEEVWLLTGRRWQECEAAADAMAARLRQKYGGQA